MRPPFTASTTRAKQTRPAAAVIRTRERAGRRRSEANPNASETAVARMRTAASSHRHGRGARTGLHMFSGVRARGRVLRYARPSDPEEEDGKRLTDLARSRDLQARDTPGGKRVYIDPWLEEPEVPESEKEPERVDLIALTHGHVGPRRRRPSSLPSASGCPVVAMIELRDWLTGQGLPDDASEGGNKGGTIREGREDHPHARLPLLELETISSTSESRAGLILDAGGRQEDLLRRRHVRLRRHAAHRPDLRARPRCAADRRPLHDGAEGGRRGRSSSSASARCVPCHYGTFPL